jgi:hypothetical protein
LDPNAEVATAAIHQASHLKIKEAVPILLRVVLDDSEKAKELRDTNTSVARVVSSAAKALIMIADRSIEPQLIEATLHRLPQIRMYAAQILGGFRGSGAVSILGNLLDDTECAPHTFWGEQLFPKFAVHKVVAKALDQVGSDDAIALLRRDSALGPEDCRDEGRVHSKTRPGESLDNDFGVNQAPMPGYRQDPEKSRDANSHAFRLAPGFPVVDETHGREIGSKADRLALTPTESEVRDTRLGTPNLNPARRSCDPGLDRIRRARCLKFLDDRRWDYDPTEECGKDFVHLDQNEVIQGRGIRDDDHFARALLSATRSRSRSPTE